MDAAALEARFRHLEQKNAELEREIQLLRTAVHEPKEDAREGALLPRRDLLKGAAYTLGAVSLSLMSPRHAEADIGTMIYGTLNDAGGGATELRCRSFSTLRIINSREHDDDPLNGNALYALSVSGHAIRAQVPGVDSVGAGLKVDVEGSGSGVNVVKNGHNGYGVLALHNSPTSISGAIVGVTAGAGPGVYGRGGGSGVGVWGQLIDSAQKQSAVLGTTEGTGAAIEGQSILGRGGVFKGKKAQVRLLPSSTTTKPATGSRGDLFVDSTGRLWYCKTGGSTTGWKQLA